MITAGEIILEYKRLKELFPDATIGDGNYSAMLKKYYPFEKISIDGKIISKCLIGKVYIYQYAVLGACGSIKGAEIIKTTDIGVPNETQGLVEIIEQYIKTGRYNNDELLKSIYEKEKWI